VALGLLNLSGLIRLLHRGAQPSLWRRRLWLWLFLPGSLMSALAQGQFGDFAYGSNGTEITITGYTGAGGAVVLPGAISGLPVRTIDSSAFSYRADLTSVVIPDSVTSIGGGAFSGCTGLTSIEVAAGNRAYHSENGVLFNLNQARLIRYPGGKMGSYAIPNSVTSIGGGAFSDCTGLTSVVIPDSVTSIGGGAFSGCTGLTSIEVAADNAVYHSKDGVLFNRSQTTLIQYPYGRMGSYVIPDGVTEIGDGAFSGCTGLTSVIILDSVTPIGDWAFSGCTGLTNIEVAAGNAVYRSENGVLFNRSQTTLIRYPGGKMGNYAIPDSVTEIGQGAFSGCPGLTSVVIPNSVTSIGNVAFSECTGLTSVVIPNGVTEIGSAAFLGCTGLTSATFEGNAPPRENFGPGGIFPATAPGFTVYYYAGSAGFTSPTWWGYPAVMLPAPPDDGGELRVDSITLQNGHAVLVVTGWPRWTFELQRSADLDGAAWPVVLTLGPLTAAGPLELTDPSAPDPQAFYRVRAYVKQIGDQ